MEEERYLTETVPLLHRCVLDIPANSRVRVVTKFQVIVEGDVAQNPKETANTDWLEMINCKYVEPKSYGSRRKLQYQIDEMSELTIIHRINPVTIQKALVMETLVVTQLSQLKRVVDSLNCVTVVGLAFHGSQVSRKGKVAMIAMNCKDNLVIIDIEDFETDIGQREIWESLRTHLFENTNIVKVVHSVLPIADYLFHQHAIKIENVFDIQMAEAYLISKTLASATTETVAITLDELLAKYLPHLVIKEEIDLYKEFRTNTENERFFIRPFVVDETAKGIAISVKYLSRLRTILSQKMMKHYNSCVNVQMSSMIEGALLEMINFVGYPELLFEKTAEQVAQIPE